MAPDPGFKVAVVLKGNISKARQAIVIQLTTHCSYVNRANVSQASCGFVSDSWPFLYYSSASSLTAVFTVNQVDESYRQLRYRKFMFAQCSTGDCDGQGEEGNGHNR